MTGALANAWGGCAGCARAEAQVRAADSFPLLAAYAGAVTTPPEARTYASWLCNDCGTAGRDVAWLREIAEQAPPLTVVTLPGQPNEEPLAAEDLAKVEAEAEGEVEAAGDDR